KSVLGIAFLVCMIMMMCVGCGKQQEAKAVALTEDELAYFNGDSFFNGDQFNIRNQFLSSLYDKPEDIDLFQLFYCGSGIAETISDEELEAVIAKGSWGDCDCEKNSRTNMDKVLTEYMGITLADTKKVGLNQFVCLPQFDAYYFFHGDTNYRSKITFLSGERDGDTIHLYYDDDFYADGKKVLTLKENNGSYLFIANQKAESEAS
ncbi:MAG: peptidase, partial [Evtepia sp.]|nr:peptidase [Evtepia sp.]